MHLVNSRHLIRNATCHCSINLRIFCGYVFKLFFQRFGLESFTQIHSLRFNPWWLGSSSRDCFLLPGVYTLLPCEGTSFRLGNSLLVLLCRPRCTSGTTEASVVRCARRVPSRREHLVAANDRTPETWCNYFLVNLIFPNFP